MREMMIDIETLDVTRTAVVPQVALRRQFAAGNITR